MASRLVASRQVLPGVGGVRVHAASEMGGVWGRSLTRFDQRRIPMQEGQASPGLILGMTGCSCPSERDVGSRFGLVWSGLVLVWEAGVGADICCPVAAWLHEPTHPSSEACKKELKLRATVAPTVLQASRVEDDFSGSQQSRPRVTLHSLARCTARRFLAEGGGVGLPRPSSFPPGSPLWSGLLQASGSDWLPFDAGEGPRRPRGFFLA
jgi:hypothetical protein